MKDAVATMGTILDDDVEGRDAVHVAVIAVRAAHQLSAGDHVGKDGSLDEPVGIVDPFLTKTVQKGQRFWLYLYPRTITSLRHSWTHPAFPVEDEKPKRGSKAESEQWLRNWIKGADCPSYEILIGGLLGRPTEGNYSDRVYVSVCDEYLSISGEDASGSIPPEFWDHVEVVTGKKFANRPTYFSCSC